MKDYISAEELRKYFTSVGINFILAGDFNETTSSHNASLVPSRFTPARFSQARTQRNIDHIVTSYDINMLLTVPMASDHMMRVALTSV